MAKAVKKVFKAVGSIFGGGGKKDKPPEKKKAEAPKPDDDARKRAREMQLQRKYAGAGRAGTVLSDGESQLG